MRSVADELRLDLVRAVARLPALERISLALRLGDQDVALFQMAQGVNEADARRALARGRAVGRQPSCSNDRSLL